MSVTDSLQFAGFARTTLFKASKLTNLIHRNALFWATLDTYQKRTIQYRQQHTHIHWNTMLYQLKAVTDLDQN
jgi:hypothetical protein